MSSHPLNGGLSKEVSLPLQMEQIQKVLTLSYVKLPEHRGCESRPPATHQPLQAYRHQDR